MSARAARPSPPAAEAPAVEASRRLIGDALGTLFAYPGPGLLDTVAACAGRLQEVRPEAAGALAELAAALGPLSQAEREEIYTRTFDLSPICAPEVGWHLHGESYERGAFLVRMREMLRRLRVSEGPELPDHLSMVLPALGRLPAPEAAVLARESLRPALEKMAAGLAGRDNPYEPLLRATRAWVEGLDA